VKKSSPALTALFVLCASWSATAAPIHPPAIAADPPQQLQGPIEDVESPPAPTRPLQGTTVLVPPLISKDYVGPARPMRVLRLPIQAGKVSKMVATNLLPRSPSWIAKGHKYYSLCMPNLGKVACAPIVATATMKDIEVGAYAGDNGEPKLTFRIDPATKQEPKRLIASISYFLGRASQQAAHFDRKSSVYAPLKTGTPAALKVEIPGGRMAPVLIGETGGGGCTWDDFGGFDCSGGDGGWDGGGYEDDSYDWGSDYFGSEDSWEDSTSSPPLPSFPFGIDNGDADPCIDASGNNVCQQVIIVGERPEELQEMALPTCVVTPRGIGCGNTNPPVVGGDPTEVLPIGPTPWLPQSACNFAPVLCSEGQVPESEPPPLTDWERIQRAKQQCYDRANANMTTCYVLREKAGEAFFDTCKREALDFFRDCDKIGKDPNP
jgi:hypothetical protein